MPSQMPLSLRPHHSHSHYLFADYYLDNRVADRPEWRETDVQEGLAALAALWAQRQADLLNANEAQTEEDWIKPVLRALGHYDQVRRTLEVRRT